MTISTPTQEDGLKSTTVTILEPKSQQGLEINREVFRELQTTYNQALADGEDEFDFRGYKFVVGYAKYMLEYLDGRLE